MDANLLPPGPRAARLSLRTGGGRAGRGPAAGGARLSFRFFSFLPRLPPRPFRAGTQSPERAELPQASRPRHAPSCPTVQPAVPVTPPPRRIPKDLSAPAGSRPSLPALWTPPLLSRRCGWKGEVGSQSCASAKARPLPTPGGSLPSASVASDGPDAWRVPRGTQVRAWLGRARGLNVRPGGGGGPASLVPGAQLGAPSRSRASPGRLRALRVDALPGRTHDSHAALSREWL